MKRLRVTYFRAVDGAKLPGIGGQAGASAYVFDGFTATSSQGGGKVASMYLVDGAIRVRKKDAAGQPLRNFGVIAMGGGKTAPVLGDFVDIPIHMVNGYVCVEEEAEGEAQDPPPAKPAQGQQQRR